VVAHVVELNTGFTTQEVYRFNAALVRQAEERLIAMLSIAGAAPNSRLVVERGMAGPVLERIAKKYEASLLILGAHGQLVPRGMGLGSTAHSLLCSCPIPLILMP
jgi:nucleotide-binding universal stress UspA family protein